LWIAPSSCTARERKSYQQRKKGENTCDPVCLFFTRGWGKELLAKKKKKKFDFPKKQKPWDTISTKYLY
jgi:hypothetical protein